MTETVVNAYAKINLTLDVLKKRDDNYHELRMVMQSVKLCDEVGVSLTANGAFTAHSNLRFLPNDDRNLALKAARLFLEKIGEHKIGAAVRIEKRVPVCAGLGGGSADAAAALLAMNEATCAGLSEEELMSLALLVGSDVPFCVHGGTALALGRGEILTRLPELPQCEIVIAKPALQMSTPELFSRLELSEVKCRPDTEGLITALEAGELAEVSRRCFNVFEEALPRTHAQVLELKSALLDSGALGVSMSGTGPSVFGLFEKGAGAEKAAEELRTRVSEVFLTSPQETK